MTNGLKTIYSHDGIPLTDFRASVTRSSLLNDIGEAIFRITTDSRKCRREFLEYGNYIVVRHDTLPAWVGMIDTPRIWGRGYVEVHAFELPLLLQFRFPPLNSVMSGVPSEMVKQLIDWANAQFDTRIRMGNQSGSGLSAEETVSESCYHHIKTISENNGQDWLCSPTFDENGNLSITLDWLDRAGIDTGFELAQGYNIKYGDNPMEESGTLINMEEAISDPMEDGIVSSISYSPMPYGLRAVQTSYSGVSDTGTLHAYAGETVRRQKSPSINTPLIALNVGDTFANVRLGNVMNYRYIDIGFDGSGIGSKQSIRIEGYRYIENEDTCELFVGRNDG